MPAKPEFSLFPDVYRAKFASPVIYILKYMSMNAFEVGWVKQSRDTLEAQLGNPVDGRDCLKLLKAILVFNPSQIFEDSGARIDVGINGHCARCREPVFSFQRGIPHESARPQ